MERAYGERKLESSAPTERNPATLCAAEQAFQAAIVPPAYWEGAEDYLPSWGWGAMVGTMGDKTHLIVNFRVVLTPTISERP